MFRSSLLPVIHRSSKSAAGFTLVELLVGTTLAGAVMAAVLSSYIFLGRSFARLANQQILETEARRTLTYFARDVQMASGIDTTVTVSSSRVSLIVPVGSSTNTITYFYNPSSPLSVNINGSSIIMAGSALTRCVYDGSTVTSQILLRNILTTNGCIFRYYDGSVASYPYDNGSSPYITVTTYASGIKQLSLQFSTQLGVSANGTQTLVYQVASSRLLIHNSALLQ